MNLQQFTKESALQHSEETRIIVWLMLSFVSVSVGLVTLFGYFRFKRISNLIIIRKRYAQIVFFEAKLSMFTSFILIPLMQCNSSYFSFLHEYHSHISIITWVLYPICHWLIGCEVARLWLICYDLNYLKETQNNQWKQEITNKLQRNWYIEHRKTFGSYHYITRCWGAFFFCTGAIIGIIYSIFDRNSITMLIDGTLYGLPVIFTIYLYWKCPKIVDKFFFALEFRTTTFVFVSSLTLFFVGQVIAFVNPFIGEIFNLIDGLYAFSTTSLVSTLWLPYLIMGKKVWIDQWNCEKQMISMVASSSKVELKAKHVQHQSRIPLLTDIFSDCETMEPFALHLCNEFSLECILSFIECIQYKLYLNQMLNGSMDDFVFLDGYKISFAFNKPLKSSIVYDSFELNESNAFDEQTIIEHFKRSALVLYKKYIYRGSELEVNIDSDSRCNYDSLLGNEEAWMKQEVSGSDLLQLFDPLCHQMYKLMEYSLIRFVTDILNPDPR